MTEIVSQTVLQSSTPTLSGILNTMANISFIIISFLIFKKFLGVRLFDGEMVTLRNFEMGSKHFLCWAFETLN